MAFLIPSLTPVLRLVGNTEMKKDLIRLLRTLPISYHIRKNVKTHKGDTKAVCSKAEEIS